MNGKPQYGFDWQAEFYMRRQKKHYFRDKYGHKIMVEPTIIPLYFEELKYGDVCDIVLTYG